ncbi:S8 family serine peptidase [Geobacter sp. AOG1]|uniref:S8 family serine peptidase n=1 Tax=Geobacter sp. AOG1 TaxID=1566346 RepID=UPI001CC73DEF|nr:S8 family serine peptidase [Geobacter sp. AOG1]GFE56990.1 hypothetical protein AOG1_08690 [Geobacter sp. AOG1]
MKELGIGTYNVPTGRTRSSFAILLVILTIIGGLFYSATNATAADTVSLVVKLVDGLTPADQAAVIARNGGAETSSVPALRLHVVTVPAADQPLVQQNYQADAQVVTVEVNKSRKAEAIPTDANYGVQWALSKIGWESVFGTVAPTGTATLALLDTGVDATHPDLAGKVIPGTSILDGSNGLSDPSGHGTWLAGIAAAATDNGTGIAGVAFGGVQVMPVSVLNAGGIGQDSDIIAGIVWAVDHGADVILMGFSNPDFSQNLQDAIDYAWSKGAVLVAATGNDGVITPTFPAGDRGVIGVSATDQNDLLAAVSNYGQDTFLAAPGTDIYTTAPNGGYSYITGTSASSAFVAGAAAFMKAVDPTLTNGIIVGRLARSADAIGTAGDPNNPTMFGNGRLNMANALADTGIDPVQPAGTPGGGGPFVGPYTAAASVSSANTDTYSDAAHTTAIKSFNVSDTVYSYSIIGITGGSSADYRIQWYSSQTVFSSSTLARDTVSANHGSGTYYTADSYVPTTTGSYSVLVCKGASTGACPPGNRIGVANFTVNKVTPTLSVTNSSVIYNGSPQAATISAGSVAGSVSNVKYNGLTTVPANAGTYTVTADFAPTDTTNYNTLTGASAGNFTISQASSSTVVTCSAGPFTYNGAAQTPCTAQMSGAGGLSQSLPVSYSNNINAGTATASASFAGDTNHTGSSDSKNFTIGKATPTATLAVSNSPQSYYGTPQAATVAISTSSVPGSVANILTGGATTQTNAGNYAVTADFVPADTANYANLTGLSAGNFLIGKASQAITFAALSDKTAGAPAFDVTASADSGLTVGFSSLTTSVCTVTGSTVTLTNLAGICTIRASQGGNDNFNAATDVDNSFNVIPGPAVAFTVTAPSSSTAGSFFDVTVTAKDQYNNTATGYLGTVHFTTTDRHTGITQPANFTFQATDKGTNTFTRGVALLTAGNQTVTATDIATASINGTSSNINITPAAASAFIIDVPAAATAGTPFTVTVTAQDSYGNTDTNYTGTVQFTSSDSGAVILPANYHFVASDNGSHAFTNVTLVTAGSQTVTLTDTTNSSMTRTSGSINVGAGAANKLAFTAQPTNTTALQKITPPVAVAVQDQYGNIVTSNTDTVSLAIGTNPAGGTLSGTASKAAVSGIASFEDLSIDYAGTGYTLAATSGTLTGATSSAFDIAKADQTITVTTHAPANATYGTSFTVDASAPGGGINYSSDGGCTNIGAIFTMTSGTTACTVMYDQPGNNSYKPATQIKETVTAQKADAVITVTPYSVIYDGNAHTATATTTGVKGEDLSSQLTLSGTTHTDAGDYPADAWTFAGNGNYNAANGTVNDKIAKANATINVVGYTGTYDAAAHGATGTATGVGGVDLSTGLNLGAKFTDYPGGAAHWTFTGGTNYNDQSGAVAIVINKADATVTVNGYTGTYDAAAHGATGSAKGVGNVDLGAGLNLGSTFTNVPGGTAHWTFTGGTNYNDQSDDVAIVINKADATVTVNGYTGTYDAAAHGPTGTATGVGGVDLSAGLNLGAKFTDYPGGTANWSFTGGTNYNDQNGTAAIVINKADATVTVNGYTGTYDAAAHGATGSAKGVGNVDLGAGLNLGSTFTNVPGGTAHWTFTGGTNYNDQSGDVAIVINRANATVTVNGYTGTYDAAAHGATGSAKGVGNVDLGAGLNLGSTFTNVPGGTAHWTFTGGTNYNDQSGDVAIVINRANATISVGSWTGTYDGTAHGATGTAKGIGGIDLCASLNLGSTFTTFPGGTAHWTFSGGINYYDASGDVAIVINKKPASVTPNSTSKVLGAVDPAFTGTLTGFLASDSVTATYTRVAGEAVGPYTISATLSPAGVLGNYDITYKTATFNIYFSWPGYLQPINDTAHQIGSTMSSFKAGQTIPAKFVLQNAVGTVVLQTKGNPTFTRTGNLGTCGTATIAEDVAALQADTTPVYMWDGSQYHYNWSTKGLSAGKYRIFANLEDGTSQWVDICLTK